MRRLTSIVALNEKGAIGCQNALPWRLKTDLQFFREQTTGNVVIMGRRTYDSIGKPLANRFNVVLSHNSVLFPSTDASLVATSVDEALVAASRKSKKEVFVVGGSSTYEQFSKYVDRYIITVVNKDVPGADAFFDGRIIGNEDDWNWKKLEGIFPDPTVDDANFEIFEVTSKNPGKFFDRRVSVIKNYELKMGVVRKSKRSSPLSSFKSAIEMPF